MTPIEIIALAFAIAILVKLVIVFFAADKWMNFASSLAKRKGLMMLLYVGLAALIGYYVWPIGIVNIFAAIVFGSLLFGLAMLPHLDQFVKMHKKMSQTDMLKRHWLSLLIWLALAGYVLYTLLL